MMATLAAFVWLVLVWLSLTGSLAVGTIVTAVLVAALVLFYFQPAHRSRGETRFRPLFVLDFAWYFTVRFLQANLQVALAVIQPERVRTRRAIVAVPVVGASDTVLILLANAVTLTPGTFVLEIDRDPTCLYVHVLRLTTVREVQLEILEMERRLVRALGTRAALEQVHERMARIRDEREPAARGV
jgi:multicomponent Na+:H+ antiporter subunit E